MSKNQAQKNAAFQKLLNNKIAKNINNNYQNNFDFTRYSQKIYLKQSIKGFFLFILFHLGLLDLYFARRKTRVLIDSFGYLYNFLEDDYSKKLLLRVLSFRLLGFRKIKLPIVQKKAIASKKIVQFRSIKQLDNLTVSNLGKSFGKYTILNQGHKFSVLATLNSVNLFLNDRCYKQKSLGIGVEPGDVVIDAGGCFGDTAIFFSEMNQNAGKIYSFEFVPENINIFNHNLALNKNKKNIIIIIDHPIWSKSGQAIYSGDIGPGSIATIERASSKKKFISISIDDFIQDEKIKSVDFIKMDIEGSELMALKGARKTIIANRPKLAICLYHKPDDCKTITKYIQELNLGYKFYFDHFSIHSEESVLFAKAN
jgi:FkbM family methyltransferase